MAHAARFTILVALTGCIPPLQVDTGDDPVVLQRARAQGDGDGAFVAVDVFGVADDGTAILCDQGQLDSVVRVTLPDGTVRTFDKKNEVEIVCSREQTPRLGLVLDNSGSQVEVLEETRTGAGSLVDGVLGAGGEAAIVRSSTFSSPLIPLTDDGAALDAVLDGLFVNEGWTALWDAVRMGNEALAEAPADPPASDLDDWCASATTAELVVMTNGVDNNSAEERLAGDGDGIDTTFEDILALTTQGAGTPVHTLALGRGVDHEILRELSQATGGGHVRVESSVVLAEAFGLVDSWMDSTWRICVEVEDEICGPAVVEFDYVMRGCNQGIGNGSEGCDPGNSNQGDPSNSNDEPTGDGRGNGNGNNGNGIGNGDMPDDTGDDGWEVVGQGTKTFHVHIPCGDAGVSARSAAVLLDLSAVGPGGDTMVRDLATWALDGGDTLVVVVDDRASDGSALPLVTALAGSGIQVRLMDEPEHGLGPQHVTDADAVWFVAGDHPMDDHGTADTLRWLKSSGVGVVLQGEDIGRGLGASFKTTPITGLAFANEGTKACGVRTDEAGWSVDVAPEAATILPTLVGTSWAYTGDLDITSVVDPDATVLAWAEVAVDGCTERVPAVVVSE